MYWPTVAQDSVIWLPLGTEPTAPVPAEGPLRTLSGPPPVRTEAVTVAANAGPAPTPSVAPVVAAASSAPSSRWRAFDVYRAVMGCLPERHRRFAATIPGGG